MMGYLRPLYFATAGKGMSCQMETDPRLGERGRNNDTTGIILPLIVGFSVVMLVWTTAVTVAILLGY